MDSQSKELNEVKEGDIVAFVTPNHTYPSIHLFRLEGKKILSLTNQPLTNYFRRLTLVDFESIATFFAWGHGFEVKKCLIPDNLVSDIGPISNIVLFSHELVRRD